MDVEKVLGCPDFERKFLGSRNLVDFIFAIYFPYVHNFSRKVRYNCTRNRGREERVVYPINNNRTIEIPCAWDNLSMAHRVTSCWVFLAYPSYPLSDRRRILRDRSEFAPIYVPLIPRRGLERAHTGPRNIPP